MQRAPFLTSCCLLSLATASATWRRPAQRVSFYLWRRPAQLGDGRATRIFYLWQRPAQLGDGPRNLLTPGNTELGETSGTHNFLSLTSCCLCLWRRPAILATARSTRIFYLWRRPAQPGDGRRDRDCNRVSFIFGDGQRNWRRPAQFVNSR